jgi:hypothetical protein
MNPNQRTIIETRMELDEQENQKEEIEAVLVEVEEEQRDEVKPSVLTTVHSIGSVVPWENRAIV